MTHAKNYARWTLLLVSVALLLATSACVYPGHGGGHNRAFGHHGGHGGHYDGRRGH